MEATSDGAVWALWRADPEDPDQRVIGYHGTDGWQSIDEWPYEGYRWGFGGLLVSDRGEVWAVDGPSPGASGDAFRVSANSAAITRTRSLSTPIFEAAFLGAPSFGVTTLAPATTRALNGLLVLHDLLSPEAATAPSNAGLPEAERAARVRAQQVHGGVNANPYTLDASITFAALLGMAQSPSLALGMLRG